MDLPGQDRRRARRLERTLNDDLPGAPPGYLLDPDDHRTGGAGSCCAEPVANALVNVDDNPLAHGAGEED